MTKKSPLLHNLASWKPTPATYLTQRAFSTPLEAPTPIQDAGAAPLPLKTPWPGSALHLQPQARSCAGRRRHRAGRTRLRSRFHHSPGASQGARPGAEAAGPAPRHGGDWAGTGAVPLPAGRWLRARCGGCGAPRCGGPWGQGGRPGWEPPARAGGAEVPGEGWPPGAGRRWRAAGCWGHQSKVQK